MGGEIQITSVYVSLYLYRIRKNRGSHKLMLFVFHHPLKMEPIRSSETSDLNIRMPEKYPEELSTFIQHGESLKTSISKFFPSLTQLQSQKFIKICVVMRITNVTLQFTII